MATIKQEVHKLSSEAARVMDENAALGGSLEISSSEKGTTVTAIVPAPGSEITSARQNVA